MLKFLGTGSAFNSEFGDNSAFFRVQDELHLIDCGGTVFGEITKRNLLMGINKVFVYITHTHPDHIGSLGTLIFYCHFVKKIKPIVVFPDADKLIDILGGMGVSSCFYSINKPQMDVNNVHVISTTLKDIVAVSAFETKHDPYMKSYGYYFFVNDFQMCYGGDSCEIPSHALNHLENNRLNMLYIDVCGLDYPGNVHLYYGKAKELIKPELRSKVTCMHFDQHTDVLQIELDGFNVANSNWLT